MKIRIYYHHTDCGGVVYYGTYLQFLEAGRTEYLEQRGVSVKELMDAGITFVIYRQEIDYKFPAVYGDVVDVETRVTNISEVKIEFDYTIRNQNGRILTRAKTIMVSVNKQFEATPLPDAVRAKLLSAVPAA